MLSIELDWMYGDTLDVFKAELARWAAEDGVVARVTQDVGPAGGWPVVAIEGERDALRAFVVARYLGGEKAAADRLNGLASLIDDYGLPAELL